MILDQKRISFNDRSTNIPDVTPVSACNNFSSPIIPKPPSKNRIPLFLLTKAYKYHKKVGSTTNIGGRASNSLYDMNENLWTKPITKGKWSVSKIIAHITNWDHHLLTEVLPSVRNEKGMEFPDFDTHNKIASDYDKTGISQSELFKKAKNIRELLVKELKEIPIEKLNKPLPSME